MNILNCNFMYHAGSEVDTKKPNSQEFCGVIRLNLTFVIFFLSVIVSSASRSYVSWMCRTLTWLESVKSPSAIWQAPRGPLRPRVREIDWRRRGTSTPLSWHLGNVSMLWDTTRTIQSMLFMGRGVYLAGKVQLTLIQVKLLHDCKCLNSACTQAAIFSTESLTVNIVNHMQICKLSIIFMFCCTNCKVTN